MGKKDGGIVVGGTIQTEYIKKAHQQVKAIVESYKNVNLEVNLITNTVKENWVGDGAAAFKSQYGILIRKIDDFGETLQDIYDNLVQAEADYQTSDNDLKSDFRAAME